MLDRGALFELGIGVLTRTFAGQKVDAAHRTVGEPALRVPPVTPVDQNLNRVSKINVAETTLGETHMPKTVTLENTGRQAAMLLVTDQLGKVRSGPRGQQDRSVHASRMQVLMEVFMRRRRRSFWPVCVIPALIAAGPVPSAPGDATPAAAPTVVRKSAPIAVDADQAQMIQMSEPAKSVFVANPDIADVQVPTQNSFLVYGKKPGTTTIFAISESGNTISYTVRVSHPASEIAAAIHNAVSDAKIRVTGNPNGVTISGSVDSPKDAEKVKVAARQFLGDKETINFDVSVNLATQVTLKVQVAELSRSVDKQLGVHWSAFGNVGTIGVFPAATIAANGLAAADVVKAFAAGGNLGGNFSALITALDNQGLATILAEPTLTAISGETANFLAGGQFPIPVPQGNQVTTIQYKNFGVSVDFTPTVLNANRISVKVRPEVSELSSVGAITLDNVSVPALNLRRAETTVELASGESFAIAGLFQNNGRNEVDGLPLLRDLPILGALFRSTSFQRNESELVIIITPIIVRPAARQTDMHLPTEGFQFSNDIERILLGRLTPLHRGAGAAPVPHLRGSAGFMLE